MSHLLSAVPTILDKTLKRVQPNKTNQRSSLTLADGEEPIRWNMRRQRMPVYLDPQALGKR